MGKVLAVYMVMSVTFETLKLHAEMFVGASAAHYVTLSEKIQIAPKEMLRKLAGVGGFKCTSWEINCV